MYKIIEIEGLKEIVVSSYYRALNADFQLAKR